MKNIIKVIIAVSTFLTSLHFCSGMQFEEKLPREKIFIFNPKNINLRDGEGNTYFHSITTTCNRDLITFFMRFDDIDINIQNNKGYTALLGLLPAAPNKIQHLIECLQLVMFDNRFEIEAHQTTINKQFIWMDSAWPGGDWGAFSNLPLLEYILPYVNDVSVLEKEIEHLNNRLISDSNFEGQIKDFLKKVIFQKNRVSC